MNVTIRLPWPAHELSQNARDHWRVLAAARKQARQTAHLLTHQAVGDCVPVLTGDLAAIVTVVPPSNRWDLLNAVAMLKPWIDGIFDVLQVNDNRIKHSRQDMADKDPDGRGYIIIEISDNWN